MDKININSIINREKEEKIVINFIENFTNDSNNRGLYIYGNNGSGKTTFIMNILKSRGYDVILYNSLNIRNKSVIETVTKNNMINKNVFSLFKKQNKKQVIVMDEIDAMLNNDKGGILSLIKLLKIKRGKKTQKDIFLNPLICISNKSQDKKILELMKVCETIEIKIPTDIQIKEIVNKLFGDNLKEEILMHIYEYVQGDLKKLDNIYNIYVSSPSILSNSKIFTNVFMKKTINNNIKLTTHKLLNNKYNIRDNFNVINDADRTSIGLLYHENIVKMFDSVDKKKAIPFYLNILDNFVFADYIDRITFQKQIWSFGELSSIIKIFKNNKLYYDYFLNDDLLKSQKKLNIEDIRFSIVLTKYSTEYNNYCFIQKLCQCLMMSKNELMEYFSKLNTNYQNVTEYIELFSNIEGISKLDLNRIKRFLERKITDDEEIINDVKELLYVDENINEYDVDNDNTMDE